MALKTILGTENGDGLAPDGKVWRHSDVTNYTDDYTIEGGTGQDRIAGAAGFDFLDGGEELDKRSNGRDYAEDGSLIVDTVYYIDSPSGIYADFEINTVLGDGFGASDEVYNFERVYGSYYDDVVTLSNEIYRGYTPMYGNDTIKGPSEFDYINGSYLGYWNLEDNTSGHEDPADPNVTKAHIIANLEDGTVNKFIEGGDFAGEYIDNFSGFIEGIVGSRGDDQMYGYEGTDYEGYRYVDGNAQVGYNWLLGAHGNDFLYQGGAGDSSMQGGRNDDILVSVGGHDRFTDDDGRSSTKFVKMSGDGSNGINWPNYVDSDADKFVIIGGEQRVQINDFGADDKLFVDSNSQFMNGYYDYKTDFTEFYSMDNVLLKINGLRGFSETDTDNMSPPNTASFMSDEEIANLSNEEARSNLGMGGASVKEVILTDGSYAQNSEFPHVNFDGKTIEETTILGSGDDYFLGSGLNDFVRTGGGEDEIHVGSGDDIVRVDSGLDDGEVIVETALGDDEVVVDRDFGGTLLLRDTGGIDTLYIDTAIHQIYRDGDDDLDIILVNGGKIEISNQFSFDAEIGKNVISEQGFDVIEFKGFTASDGGHPGKVWKGLVGTDEGDALSTSPKEFEFEENVEFDSFFHLAQYDQHVNFLSGKEGDDILTLGRGLNKIFGNEGDDLFQVSGDVQRSTIIGDNTSEPYFIGDFDFYDSDSELPTPVTQNSSFADVVEIDWSYTDTVIENVAHGYRITNEALDAVVEVYDVEILKFANGDGTWDTRYLTEGAPVGRDNWMFGNAGKDIAYGDGGNISFVLGNGTAPEGAALSDNGTSDILQVYTSVTTTVEETYTYQDSKGKTKTGTREVERTEESLIWEGDRTAVDAFTFSDGVSINVINVADKGWDDAEIEHTLGTDGIDLIFGNDSDNLIDGKGGDDIIFGGDGDDVIIGGDGDDVLVGGAGDDVIRGDGVDADDIAVGMFEDAGVAVSELSLDDTGIMAGNDTILGGLGIDDIESGEGKNLVASGRADMDGDGEADLDTIKEHMTTNKDIFDDDDWI